MSKTRCPPEPAILASKDKPARIVRRIDWAAAKAEYINHGSVTLEDIANKYGVYVTSVRQHAAREKWAAARQARATELVQKVTQKSILNNVAELSQYNAEDLATAKQLRQLVMQRLEKHADGLEPKDLRSLAGAVESAQRIAHLALGASTQNMDSRFSEADRMTPEDRRERIRQLHAQLFPTLQ